MASYRPDAIANFFIRCADPVAAGLTPMKLQKLVYFAHGWHLAIQDSPLITDDVQAWEYGPVIPRLYQALKEYGDNPVTAPIIHIRIKRSADGELTAEKHEQSIEEYPDAADFCKALLRRIWEVYGRHDAIQLSKMTHEKGSPWDQVRQRFPQYLPQGVAIPNDLIRDYFLRKLKPPHADTTHA